MDYFRNILLALMIFCILLFAFTNPISGCLERERTALLQLKASINGGDGTSFPGWEVTNSGGDCCEWERVECDAATRRVIGLLLDGTRNWNLEFSYVNASLFLPFVSLRSLNLSSNGLNGCVENEGFEKLPSKLTHLKVLDLSHNMLNNTFLSSLGKFSSLIALNLSDNALTGSLQVRDLDGLKNLKKLDLSTNELEDVVMDLGMERKSSGLNNLEELDLTENKLNNRTIPFLSKLRSIRILNLGSNNLTGSFRFMDYNATNNLRMLDLRKNNIEEVVFGQGLEKLKNLEILLLDDNYLNDDFLPSIGVIPSLKVLSAEQCGITGILPSQGFCELRNLRGLNLRGNTLGGNLPWCLANMTSLQWLDISSNNFTGNIASSPLIKLISLEYMAVSNNRFQVPITFQLFFNHSKLKFIESLNNEVLVDKEYPSSSPSFQLSSIRCSNTELKMPTRAFPYFLYHQSQLQTVELSRMNIGGGFPTWLLENNTKLATLLLADNSFAGPLHLPPHPHEKISALDISNNHFDGQIPKSMTTSFPSLSFLTMSFNLFEGTIPVSFSSLSSLRFMDLSNNKLSGGLPNNLAMGWSSLKFLKLSSNNLHEPIETYPNNLTMLEFLFLDSNHLTRIPDGLSNCSSLKVMNISDNHLQGSIPQEICQLSVQFWALDLSGNNITGTLPACLYNINYVRLSQNQLRGPLPQATSDNPITYLRMLDLSDNQLSGSIPNWISDLSHLSILLLKNNNFEGEIPVELCYLSRLSLIDFSHNGLSGTIPPCLSNITFDFPKDFGISPQVTLAFASFYDLVIIPEKLSSPSPVFMYDYLQTEIEFTTKGMSLIYKGKILQLFSGLDLSCNKLSGSIPQGIGYLTLIKALNLSHNDLTSTLPGTLSNLKNIESLDLSYNRLSGEIPQLVDLYTLAVFNVSYNNLSGMIPRFGQFSTFDETSFLGNPFLCGDVLKINCPNTEQPQSMPGDTNGSREDDEFIDRDTFYMSFAASYATMFLGVLFILFLNPHWRQAWFYYAEVYLTSPCYFVRKIFKR